MTKRIVIITLVSILANWTPFIYSFITSDCQGDSCTGLLLLLIHGIIWILLSLFYLSLIFKGLRETAVKHIPLWLPIIIYAGVVYQNLSLQEVWSWFVPLGIMNVVISILIMFLLKRKEKTKL